MSFFEEQLETMPSLGGKLAIVTGASLDTIGAFVALGLAKLGARTIIAVRSQAKGDATLEWILEQVPQAEVEVMLLNLASFDSVRRFANEFAMKNDKLDLLLCNAGVAEMPKQQTEDGNDIVIQVNLLSHVLLENLLFSALRNSDGQARVVMQSSQGHGYFSPTVTFTKDGKNFGDGKMTGMAGMANYFVGHKQTRYFQSKLAQLLFIYELDRVLRKNNVLEDEIIHIGTSPGFSDTAMPRKAAGFLGPAYSLMVKTAGHSPADGALPMLVAATDPGLKAGSYIEPKNLYGNRGPPAARDSYGLSKDEELATRVFNLANELTGVSSWT